MKKSMISGFVNEMTIINNYSNLFVQMKSANKKEDTYVKRVYPNIIKVIYKIVSKSQIFY